MEGEWNGLARGIGLQQGRTAQLLLGKEQGTDQGQQVGQQDPEVFERSLKAARPLPDQVLGEVEDLAGQLGAEHEHEEQGHPLPHEAGDLHG